MKPQKHFFWSRVGFARSNVWLTGHPNSERPRPIAIHWPQKHPGPAIIFLFLFVLQLYFMCWIQVQCPYILNLQHFDQYKNSFWFHVTGMLSHPWQHVLSVLERCVILLLAPQNQPNQQQQPHNNLQLDMVQLRRGTCGFIVVGFLNPSSSPVNALRLRVFFFRSARTS